ncbi:MAG: lipid II flippase MurJ, partial [Armatimonadota bacterium]|nr:lipid II flippase MurJ [Armatimonadota bacterium]
GLRPFFALTLPLMLAVGYSFVDQIIFSILGARLDKLSVAALNYAYRLMQVPVGALGIASATAVIGTLAGLAANGEVVAFRRQVREALTRVAAMVLPVAALMIVLAPAVVRVLLQRGEFTADDTGRVAGILRWFALGMYAWTANYVVSRAMYALKDTITPAILSTLTTVVVVPLSFVLMRPMGAAGLALATSLGISAQSLAIFLALRKRLRGLYVPAIARSLRRLTLAAVGMGAVCGALRWVLYQIPPRVGVLAPAAGHVAGALLELALVSGVGLCLFVRLSRALGDQEAAYLWETAVGGVRRRLARVLKRRRRVPA